jgi:ubiquinone/menaquinone biosynthesis C-methylase UbiE
MTHSELADKTIKEWEQAVAKDPRFNAEEKLFKRDPSRYGTISKSQDEQPEVKSPRVESAIKVLVGQKLIDKDSVVLDMGCGKGVFALPLSRIVKRVDALDFSAPVIDRLREKITREKLANIRIIQQDWRDFAQKNSGEEYHLVISSLNPSMYNGHAILEMTRLSKRACLFSSSYKRPDNSIIRDLDALILGATPEPEIDCRTIIYPFNILYYLGYKPQLEYVEDGWTTREPPEEAIKRLTRRYETMVELTDTVKDKITDFVYARQKDGIFEHNMKVYVGLLTWRVKE